MDIWDFDLPDAPTRFTSIISTTYRVYRGKQNKTKIKIK